VTYGELDRLSNQVARLVRGVTQGAVPVGLLIDDEILLVAAILGVLKSGSFYLPLEPRHGRERLDATLRHVGATCVLTDDANRELADLLSHSGAISIHAAQSMADGPVGITVSPDAHAYVYYTSGSTGAPKGVVDCHRNVLHNVLRYTNSLSIGPEDRLTLLQSCTFSGAVSNVFGALLNGATLLPYDVRRQPVSELPAWLRRAGATVYHSVPSLFRRVAGFGDGFPSVQVVRLEGDRATVEDVTIFRRAFPRDCLLVNGLGATETGIASQFFVDHDTPISGNNLSLGYATAGVDVRVVDEAGNPVAEGQTGRIEIASRYLARGYWADDAATAAVFLPDPQTPGMRRYRSGDLGRMRDGRLEWVGRADRRFKVAGEWLDGAAIEAVLTACAGVDDALVFGETALGGTRSVAYVIAGSECDVAALKQAVAAACGRSAVPRYIVRVAEWPTDANGKVDRAALTTLPRAEPDPASPAPRNATERVVAGVFARLLDHREVGRDANFFDLGGDSLLAVEAALLLGESFGTDAPLDAMQGDDATVAEVARRIDAGEPYAVLVALQPDGQDTPFHCVHAHMGHVFNLRELARCEPRDRPFYALRATSLMHGDDAPSSLAALAEVYVRAIIAVQPEGPYALGGYCFGGLIAVEMARQLEVRGAVVAKLVLIDTDLPKPFAASWIVRLARALKRGELATRLRRHLGRRRAPGDELGQHEESDLAVAPGSALAITAARLAQLQSHHRPSPYAGPATVVLRAGKRDEPGWARFLPGVTEIRRVDVRAGELLRSPSVDQIARLSRAT
jgi:amino acid adenylation domain-containing protein